MLLLKIILVLTIPLASTYLSIILIPDLLFIEPLLLCYITKVYGGLFQTTLLPQMSLLPIVWYSTPRVLYINAKTDNK